MSFDPYAAGSELPPNLEYSPSAASGDEARKRVQVPAILLIVAGVLNLFMAAWPALQGFQASRMSPAEFEDAMVQQNPSAREQMKQMGWTPEGVLRGVGWGFSIWAVVDFLMSILVILGGIRMLILKSYALAVFASVLAALPILSCTGCCGFGEVAGLWALIVLLNAENRAAFH